MRRSSYFLVVALFLSLPVAPSPTAKPKRSQECEQQMYADPDSRLTPHIIGRLPNSVEEIVAFEIIQGRPLVALPRQLIGFTANGINELTIPEPIKGLSFNKDSRVWLQTSSGFQTVGETHLESDTIFTNAVNGRLYGSGSPLFVEARAHKGILQFVARKQDGSAFTIASLKGTLRAASWNNIGLAAVVGSELYVWKAGSKNVVRLLSDQGLSAAQDVVLVGQNRAVITLRTSVVLVTDEAMTVIMGMPEARCRFDGGVLYLLDSHTGLIWAFQGLDQLGTKHGDRDYATELLQKKAGKSAQDSANFLEAARILGCQEARRIVSGANVNYNKPSLAQ